MNLKFLPHIIQKNLFIWLNKSKCKRNTDKYFRIKHNMPLVTWQILYWIYRLPWVSSVHSVVSDSLPPHGLQHTRVPCPSATPGDCPNSCPSSWWCHPTISSSVIPLSSCLQSFLASGSFPMSQFFASGRQSIRVSASASVLPRNIQDWFPLGWTGWISLQSKGLSRVFSNTTVQRHQFFSTQLSLWSNSHIHTSVYVIFNFFHQSLIVFRPLTF